MKRRKFSSTRRSAVTKLKRKLENGIAHHLKEAKKLDRRLETVQKASQYR